MRKLSLFSLVLLMVCLAMLGCRKTTSISNPHAGINTSNALSIEDVRSAIFAACPKTHWVAKDISTGVIEATLNIRAHTAVVTINYSAKDYQIKYKSSINLKAKDGTIHPYYNGWVEKLRRNIDIELASISAKK